MDERLNENCYPLHSVLREIQETNCSVEYLTHLRVLDKRLVGDGSSEVDVTMSVDDLKAVRTSKQARGEPIRRGETEQHAAIGLRQTHRRASRVGRGNRRQLDRT